MLSSFCHYWHLLGLRAPGMGRPLAYKFETLPECRAPGLGAWPVLMRLAARGLGGHSNPSQSLIVQ